MRIGIARLIVVVPLNSLIRHFAERRQIRGGDDSLKSVAIVEFHAVPIDHDGVRVLRRETPELGIDQTETPHHILDAFIRAIPESDVLVDGVAAGGQHDDPVRVPGVADPEDPPQLVVMRARILRNVRFEGNARAFEKDDAARTVVVGGVAIVRVVEAGEIRGNTHRVAPCFDVFEHPGIPDALLPLAVRSVAIQIATMLVRRLSGEVIKAFLVIELLDYQVIWKIPEELRAE